LVAQEIIQQPRFTRTMSEVVLQR